jgi:predicted protein tyrosine phosphatase
MGNSHSSNRLYVHQKELDECAVLGSNCTLGVELKQLKHVDRCGKAKSAYTHVRGCAQESSAARYTLVPWQAQEDTTHALVHLSQVCCWLFLTSAQGVANVLTAKHMQPLSIVAVSDRQTYDETRRCLQKQHESLVTYTFCDVSTDDANITPEEFHDQFFVHSAFLANKMRNATHPLVVHCALGMNRSPTAILLAWVMLSVKHFNVNKAVEYMLDINNSLRCTVLTNQAYVKLIKAFASFWKAKRHVHDARAFGTFCKQLKH